MRILILTQYFPPETGAPQNRLSALANWFHLNGHHVEVLTGMPNYPSLTLFKEYANLKSITETYNGYNVKRVSLYLGGKGFVNRLRTYFSFCWNALIFSKENFNKDSFDWVFCESPPLFLGISAKKISNHTGAKLWVNISDLWPESVEKLGIVKNKLVLYPFYQLEKWLYKHANFISAQTQGICKSIEKTSGKKVYWYPNGILLHEISTQQDSIIPAYLNGLFSKKVVLYSGNFGYAQGLELIIETAELFKNHTDLIFLLIGDGPEEDKLKSLVNSKKLSNVYIFNSVSRSVLISIIKQSIASIVPLRDIELFRGAIPSKIFEPLAIGTTVLLGVKGEAYDIFCVQSDSVYFFEPEDQISLSQAIAKLLTNEVEKFKKINNGKTLINLKFNRDQIHKDLFAALDTEV